MSDLFKSFIARLEQTYGEPVVLTNESAFSCLFEGNLLVTTNVSDNGQFVVLDAWVHDSFAMLPTERMALFSALLELNALAGTRHDAVFSLDQDYRIILSCSIDLADITLESYLHDIAKLLDQTRQTRRMIYLIAPESFIAAATEDAPA
jgi:hypothetical protein